MQLCCIVYSMASNPSSALVLLCVFGCDRSSCKSGAQTGPARPFSQNQCDADRYQNCIVLNRKRDLIFGIQKLGLSTLPF
jgi:hypothetical protein